MATIRRSNIERIRAVALALPETTEEVTWGTDVNSACATRSFCFPGETTMTVKADSEELDALLGDDRFAQAAYVGRFGWVTMTLRSPIEWDEIGELVRTSYCLVAPKALAKVVAPPA